MVDIHSARQDAKYIRNAGYGTAASIIEELCDEIKQLLEANEWLKAQRILDNEEAARLYDFARDNGKALERDAVVALLRESQRMYQMHRSPGAESLVRNLADIIQRGEHRREEER